MKLLFEEFFGKLRKVKEGNSITVKITYNLFVIGLVIGLLILIGYSILFRKYLIIMFILGIYFLGELAHYIRKSREKIMMQRGAEENKTKSFKRDLLESKKSENKNLLNFKKVNKNLSDKNQKISKKLIIDKDILKTEKSKNKDLLNQNKDKNKSLLK